MFKGPSIALDAEQVFRKVVGILTIYAVASAFVGRPELWLICV